ncbi:2-keto-4-pentenoate hydratase/2-oxohepta-3-ene-1,7-dioic acid hydratase in catechol pathway [Sphingomonas sp. SORGH_AS438]|nr:2-keto-4-pentenoate hydratase/2-oxohepta-3-ene-1,7-dioic acid hydratase in catechol pathway [Sphingomonas sp. SORGH_AS_0438]
MKLASLKDASGRRRDGTLVVVSNDLAWYADAGHIVPTLQAALDDWDQFAPALENLATDLEHGAIPRGRFHEHDAASPLPRAYQWADGSAYVNHVALVRQARGAELPDSFWHDPLMYQGGSDGFLGPRDPIPLADESWGCDLEGEVVVVTGDVPQGASRAEALAAVRLVGLTNDVSLRGLIPGELAKGFGFFQSKPASAFSPVFVTPEALGDWWRDGKLHRTLMVDLNGPALRPDRGGRGHDLRLRHADRACRQDPGAGRGHDHRIGHRVQPRRRWRAGQADRGGRGRLCLSGGAADRGDDPGRRGEDAVPEAGRHGANLDGG